MSEEAIQDTGSQEGAVADAAPVSFLESLPEEIRNEPSLRTFTDPGTLAKSYVSAQRMIGADKVAIPGSSATADDWREVYTRLGAPTEASQYELGKDIPLDDSYVNSFREHALNAGLNGQQANTMMEFVKSAVTSMNDNFTQGTEEAQYAAEQELRQEFGQAFEQRLEVAQLAANQLLGGTEMFDEIILADGRMLGDHPDIIRMFSNLATQIGEDNIEGTPTEMIMTPEEANRQLADITRLDGPYGDRMHPQHDEYVQTALRLREFL